MTQCHCSFGTREAATEKCPHVACIYHDSTQFEAAVGEIDRPVYKLMITNNDPNGTFPKKFLEGTVARHVEIRGRNLMAIKEKTFQGLDTSNLIIQANNLPQLHPKAFLSLNGLESLKITAAKLPHFKLDLSSLSRLKQLDLSRNGIRNINYIPFHRNIETKNVLLLLYGNPLECDCRLRWLRETVWLSEGNYQGSDLGICDSPKKLREKRVLSLKPEMLSDCEPKNKDKAGSSGNVSTLHSMIAVIAVILPALLIK